MGLSSSKTKTTNAPSTFSQPYVTAGANALGSAYGQSSGIASSVSDTISAQLPGLAEKAFTPDAGITAATDYNNNVLGGKYLDQGNPYLEAQIAATNGGVRDRVSAQFSAAGRTGSGANQYALGKALSENETGLRYTDYSNERSRMGASAGLAPSLAAGQYSGLAAYLQASQAAAGLPLDTASQYASGVGGLVGQYGTQTGKTSPGLGLILAQAAASAAKAYGGGG